LPQEKQCLPAMDEQVQVMQPRPVIDQILPAEQSPSLIADQVQQVQTSDTGKLMPSDNDQMAQKPKRTYTRKPKIGIVPLSLQAPSKILIEGEEEPFFAGDWRELVADELMDYFEHNRNLDPSDIEDLIKRFENEEDNEVKYLYETILHNYGKI